jgi:hypothetical protein
MLRSDSVFVFFFNRKGGFSHTHHSLFENFLQQGLLLFFLWKDCKLWCEVLLKNRLRVPVQKEDTSSYLSKCLGLAWSVMSKFAPVQWLGSVPEQS